MDFPIIQIKDTDPRFPPLLKEIIPPPRQLYCRGNVELLKSECLAVVGTRRMTSYGKEAAMRIVSELAWHFTVVSGLALGIDAAAHEAALSAHPPAGGKTIAVLSGGVRDQQIGPRANFLLAQRILKQDGLIISEYDEKGEIYPSDFPVRNRIVSGLSRGVLIIEADVKSGSLITAKWATEQNRDLFAVPGSIFSARTEGPHFLIKKGAKMVTSAQDIFDEYNILPLDKAIKRKQIKLTALQESIILALEEHGSATLDDFIETCQKETSEVLVAVSGLELKGMIKESGNGKYILV